MSLMSVEAQYFLRLLEDMEWHDLEEMLAKTAQTIPPGKALRKFETGRVYTGVRPDFTEDEKILSGQRSYAVVAFNSLKKRWLIVKGEGADRKVMRREAPLKLDRDGNVIGEYQCTYPDHQHSAEDAPEPVERAARPSVSDTLIPCESCGFYIANEEQHENFHVLFDAWMEGHAPPRRERSGDESSGEMALFDEDQVRRLLREELHTVLDNELDRFQKGLQRFLIERFAALEEVLGAPVPKPNQRHR